MGEVSYISSELLGPQCDRSQFVYSPVAELSEPIDPESVWATGVDAMHYMPLTEIDPTVADYDSYGVSELEQAEAVGTDRVAGQIEFDLEGDKGWQ